MRVVALVAMLVPALVRADVQTDTIRAAAALTAGVRAHDARAIGTLLGATFTNGGVWFADAACAREFAEPSDVSGKRVTLFARCLAKHRVQLSTRVSSRRDGAVLTVEPGIEIELSFRGSQIAWIGHPLHDATGPIIPTLTAQAFESLRTGGTTSLDHALSATVLELGPGGWTSTWIKICLDASGTRTSVSLHGVPSVARRQRVPSRDRRLDVPTVRDPRHADRRLLALAADLSGREDSGDRGPAHHLDAGRADQDE